jgi:glycosyltransferase involved in cell wall biosynthesis
MVLVEAMACGLPVVSFACPCGPKDIVAHGEDGLLVENGNVEQLADALIGLMKDAEARQTMASKAVANVQRFRMEALAGQWKQLFTSILS